MTNLLLIALALVLVATGLVAWALPESRATFLYDAHRLAGAALVVLLLPKQVIARASLRRRLSLPRPDASLVLGLLAGAALLATLGLGLAWTLGLVSFDALAGYSPLNLHVFIGLAVVPLALAHLVARWQSLPAVGRLLSRRRLLRLGVLSAASLVLWQVVDSVAGARDAFRRVTGSKHAGSFSGNAFPYTIWLFDEVPRLDATMWRLEVSGRVARSGTVSYADLTALPQREVTAVLDCTGGWWSEQVWHGVAVGEILARHGVLTGAREAAVVSVTGHRWTFPLEELRDALLATRVGGEVLDPGHGYPVRLVAPGRRGFQWVKWVARIEIA